MAQSHQIQLKVSAFRSIAPYSQSAIAGVRLQMMKIDRLYIWLSFQHKFSRLAHSHL
jgi:hypothetical protein